MSYIPVLNDSQMAALRRVLGTNQKLDLTVTPRATARRLPSYQDDQEIAASYSGYFMLALHDAGGESSSGWRVWVVDGATYDGANLSGSGNSICKVNNRVFEVAPWESAAISGTSYGTRIVALRFTPGESSAQDSVEPVLLEELPDDSESAAYCQLGRVVIPRYGQPHVVQDHTAGVAQIWWYLLCR